MLYDSFKVLIHIPEETNRPVEDLQGQIEDYITDLTLAIEDVEMPDVVRTVVIETDDFTPPLHIRNKNRE